MFSGSKIEASTSGVGMWASCALHSARNRSWIFGCSERSQVAHMRAEAVVSWLKRGASGLEHHRTVSPMGWNRKDLPSSEKGKHLTDEVVVGEMTRFHNACDDVLVVSC